MKKEVSGIFIIPEQLGVPFETVNCHFTPRRFLALQ